MNTCITIETIINYFSTTMSTTMQDNLFAHLAFCEKCRTQFIESEALIHACKDIQWAQISRAEARQIIEKLSGKKILPILKEWVTETFPFSTDSIFRTDPCLVPIVNEWRSFRGVNSIDYQVIPIKTSHMSTRLFWEREKINPFSFGIKFLDVVFNESQSLFRFILLKNKQLIVSHPVAENTLLKAGLMDGTYHLVIKQNAQDIYQLDFTINAKGILL